MSAANLKRHMLQLRTSKVQDRSGDVSAVPVNPRAALEHAAQALARIVGPTGSSSIWHLVQPPSAHPSMRDQFYWQAEAPYVAQGTRAVLRLGCVGTYVNVSYSDFTGTETLLSLNFQDTFDWRMPLAASIVETTVNTVWEALEEWLGRGMVMWEEQSPQ
jgi:hypothetical protein